MPKVTSSIRKRMKSVSIAPCTSTSVPKTRNQKLDREPTPSKPKKGHTSVVHNKTLREVNSGSDDESLPDLDLPSSDRINPSQKTPEIDDECQALKLTLENGEVCREWYESLDLSVCDAHRIAHDMITLSLHKMWKSEENCEDCIIRKTIQSMSSNLSQLADIVGKYLADLSRVKKNVEWQLKDLSVDKS